MQREVDVETDKILADQFDDHVRNIMSDLSNKLRPELPAYVINTNITKVKTICILLVFSFLKLLQNLNVT